MSRGGLGSQIVPVDETDAMTPLQPLLQRSAILLLRVCEDVSGCYRRVLGDKLAA